MIFNTVFIVVYIITTYGKIWKKYFYKAAIPPCRKRQGFLARFFGEKHNTIAGAIYGELYSQLKYTSCRTYMSDMRTKVNDQLYYYPDVVVGCNIRLEIIDNQETLVNPILVVEVLSPSTEKYDRNTKLREYQQIDSLRYCLIVAQNEVNANLLTKQDDNSWISTTYINLENSIELPLINARLLLSDIYLNVSF